MTTHSELCATLRQLRTDQGVSVAELATAVGVQRTTIYRIESGEFWPSVPQLMAIVAALGYEIAILPALPGSLPTYEVRES